MRAIPLIALLFICGYADLRLNAAQGFETATSAANTVNKSAIIQAAMPEVRCVKLDVAKYQISVIEGKGSYVVLFEDPDQPEGQLGSSSQTPSFEVEVSKIDLHIIRANFVR